MTSVQLRLQVAPLARRDLAREAEYLRVSFNVQVANHFLAEAEHTMALLRMTPRIGIAFRIRRRDGAEVMRIPIFRPFDEWALFYTLTLTELRVERIMHRARDLSNLFT